MRTRQIRSMTTGHAPQASDLGAGELAINFPDGKIFSKDDDGNIKTLVEPQHVFSVNGKEGVIELSIDDLLPSFDVTFSISTNLVEMGATVANPNFTASWTTEPQSRVLTDSEGTSPKNITGSPFTSSGTFTKSAYGQSVTFTLTSENSSGSKTVVRTAILSWGQRVYFGTGVPGFNSEAQIKSLQNNPLSLTKNRTFTVTASSSQKIYYAYRTGYGPSTFFVGGFEGGFNLVSTSIPVTNSQGLTENYTLYESDNVGLGSTTVQVV